MPFVKKCDRKVLDRVYDEMLRARIKANGDLNYILYKYCKYRIDKNYNNLKNFMAELTECVNQIRNDFLIPYEEKKRKENGDV